MFGLLPCVGSVSLVLIFDLQMVQGEVLAHFCGGLIYRHVSANRKMLKQLLGKEEISAKLFPCPSRPNIGKGHITAFSFIAEFIF